MSGKKAFGVLLPSKAEGGEKVLTEGKSTGVKFLLGPRADLLSVSLSLTAPLCLSCLARFACKG